jgi:hypothetical protein
LAWSCCHSWIFLYCTLRIWGTLIIGYVIHQPIDLSPFKWNFDLDKSGQN